MIPSNPLFVVPPSFDKNVSFGVKNVFKSEGKYFMHVLADLNYANVKEQQ